MDRQQQWRIWSRAAGVLTLLVAAGLMAQAARIDLTGAYTRERAAEALGQLMPLIVLWMISLLAGWRIMPRGRRVPMRVIPAEGGTSGRMRAVLYAVAAALITLGVMNGGMRDVLVKAINICTECIGLG